MFQSLGVCASTAVGMGSIPGWGTKILHAPSCSAADRKREKGRKGEKEGKEGKKRKNKKMLSHFGNSLAVFQNVNIELL